MWATERVKERCQHNSRVRGEKRARVATMSKVWWMTHREINALAGDGLALPHSSQFDDERPIAVVGDWTSLDRPCFELRDSFIVPLEVVGFRIDALDWLQDHRPSAGDEAVGITAAALAATNVAEVAAAAVAVFAADAGGDAFGNIGTSARLLIFTART